MESGTAEERIEGRAPEDPQDLDSLLDSPLEAANEETAKIEEPTMTEPDDLEVEEKKIKRAAKKPAGRPRITSTRKPPVKTATKKTATNGDAKASLAIDEGTKRLVRKLRAQMELETGNRVSFAEAITAAVEKALE